MTDLEVPVLIVGGSLVGMTASMLLAHHGVRALTVEHHRGTAIHPRAALINQRTMEVLRTLGMEGVVRERSETQFQQDGAIVAVESLAGKELARFIPNINEGIRDVSPTVRLFITQKLLEPLMQKRAQELGADLRFTTEMISFEQDAAGVKVIIRHRDTGKTQIVRARYMIAADGVRSSVREKLGIEYVGRGIFSKSITIYFHAPVRPLLTDSDGRDRNLSVIYVRNPAVRGFFRIEKPYNTGFLVANTTGDFDHPSTDLWTGLTTERCVELVRAGLGDASIPIEVYDVMKWNARADTVDQYRDNHIILAGDSAHTLLPYGGFNGNCGVQDVHNLAWKLAQVIKGEANTSVLETYGQERQRVGAFTAAQAYTRYVLREAKYLDDGTLAPMENDLNVEMGYRYHSRAIISDPDDDGSTHEHPRQARGKPGSRAPHLWLNEGRSTLDLFGRNFVILAGPAGNDWRGAAVTASKRLNISMDFHQHDFCEAYGIDPEGAILVRPDGFVAWRAKNGTSTSAATLITVLRRILGHDGGK